MLEPLYRYRCELCYTSLCIYVKGNSNRIDFDYLFAQGFV